MPETLPSTRGPERDRCDELLIQQTIYGLDEPDQSELDELVRHFQPADDDQFETVVAAIDIGLSILSADDSSPDDFSERLRQQIISDADAYVSHHVPAGLQDPIPVPKPSASWTNREKWFVMATAVSLLLAIASLTGMFNRPNVDDGQPPSFAELREQLIAGGGPRLRQVVWTATEDKAASNASGDIVWSDAKQEGYMRFRGLAANDPEVNQYQLWIFDTERDDELPVDGGVFDIGAFGSDGVVIVPVDAKLAIAQAKMFAITIEKPGGVVQSRRERLPLLATVELN